VNRVFITCLTQPTGIFLCTAEILKLQNNSITGTLPDGLFTLSSLRLLRLDGNPQIGGSIVPGISELQKLEEIRLGTSNIGGALPSALYTLPKLEVLDLSGGQFRGQLPNEILGLNDTLKQLLLHDNEFDGPIPTVLGQFGVLGKHISVQD